MKQKVTNQLNVIVPRGSFIDEGDGVVSFPDGLTITDNSVQRNGTRYDINTLDISRYGGQLTGDHEDKLSSLIGETIGTVKENGRVAVSKIRYAINENPYARLAYDLFVSGFSKNFSIETIGLPPDPSDGVYYNAELVGLSQVVTQNNYNAHVNQFTEVVHNSLERSKENGLNVDGVEEKVLKEFAANTVEETNMEETPKETPTPETVEETPVTETVEETPVEKTEEVVEAPAENAAEVETPETPEVVETEVEEVEETPAAEETPAEVTTIEETEVVETPVETNTNKEQTMTKEELAEVVANAVAPFATELAEIKEAQKNAFDASAKEPAFKADDAKEVAKNEYAAMDAHARHQAQVNAAWNAVKMGNVEAWQTLRDINSVNLDALKEAGIARNAMTLDDLGNFVIAPEMHTEIIGHRNDYSAILNATDWQETLSLEFAWQKRVGDINMQNVALGVNLGSGLDGNDDARLKPISEYSTVPQKTELEELAAVTVIATSATRFYAADLLSDAAQGYRTDYDRKRAQLVIAELEKAIDESGQSVGYAPAQDVDALTVWLEAITEVSDVTLNGTLIFNARTFAELKSRALRAGANGPLSEILTTGDIPTIFGYKFIVVPNDLMPTLGGSETIAHFVGGESIAINHAVFFADLTVFTGRTSGGLQYDVSNSASYEVEGVTKSAYQRNELVLRGSFFRGGAVKDASRVAGIRQGAAANVS